MLCELVLIGDGFECLWLEWLVYELGLAERVRFFGKQYRFVEVLQAADVFFLTSETESFGLAALEALACGVPVVATRVGGVPEVIFDGENGFFAFVGDVVVMSDVVSRLFSDDVLYAKMFVVVRVAVESKFAMEPM